MIDRICRKCGNLISHLHRHCRECCKIHSKNYKQKDSAKIKRKVTRQNSKATEYLYEQTPKARYLRAIQSAKRRHKQFDLSLEEFTQIINLPCHYCSKPLNKTGSGLDRKNNEQFYSKENVVPCCGRCNTTFMDNYTYEGKLILAAAIRQCDKLLASLS
jgi:hypothetical protein